MALIVGGLGSARPAAPCHSSVRSAPGTRPIGFPDGVSVETIAFEELRGRTRVTTKSRMDSIEARDSMSKSGMRRGVPEGHERLDELLSGRQSGNAGRHTEKEGLRS
ncbi:hypothetical protein ACFVRU_13655 [Streptomyces sp. NPDC057927]